LGNTTESTTDTGGGARSIVVGLGYTFRYAHLELVHGLKICLQNLESVMKNSRVLWISWLLDS
jgi:hypothetical protein